MKTIPTLASIHKQAHNRQAFTNEFSTSKHSRKVSIQPSIHRKIQYWQTFLNNSPFSDEATKFTYCRVLEGLAWIQKGRLPPFFFFLPSISARASHLFFQHPPIYIIFFVITTPRLLLHFLPWSLNIYTYILVYK